MRHSTPDEDGATRWRCPFCAGFLRARQFPCTMRRPKTVPLVPVNDSCEKCCDGILTAQAAEMAWWQRTTFGTTAWRISMGRRQVAESVNAALQGAFNDLGRGFMRVVGVTKMTVMLGFTVASYNLDRIRSSRPSTAWTRRVDRLRDSSKRARSGAPVLGPTSSSGHRPHRDLWTKSQPNQRVQPAADGGRLQRVPELVGER
jgi:hypothetical protein